MNANHEENGDPLPCCWPGKGRPERHGPVTELYDSVSETLREVGGAAQSFMALRRAAADWRVSMPRCAPGGRFRSPGSGSRASGEGEPSPEG